MSTWIVKKKKDEVALLPQAKKEKVVIEKSLLVLVLDISPAQKYISEDPKILFHCIDAFITFGNTHCLLNPENEAAVIASHVNHTHFLYPMVDDCTKWATRQGDGQYEKFLEFEEEVRKNLKVVLQSKSFARTEAHSNPAANTTCLASALARALCFINRRQKELPSEDYKMNSRICVLSGSCDATSQYMAFMNVFYAAQRLGVMIDCCVMGQYATLLSQGADITKGMYLRPPQGHVGLLQHLLWSFLPERDLRGELARPPPFPVDYRAACFCHRQLISIGYVCSSCLSIFCKPGPICTTCSAVYERPPVPVFFGAAGTAKGASDKGSSHRSKGHSSGNGSRV